MEKKINDFFQNALVHDMQCIAYAYRPINTVNDDRIPFLNPSDDEDEDPGCAFVVLPYKPPSSDSSDSSSDSSSESSSSSSSSSRVQNEGKRTVSSVAIIENASKTRRISKAATSSSSSSSDTDSSDYSFEEDEPVDEQEEATFYKEVVKGQIFLGMTAMCHQPKQVTSAI
jgi:hypothetical protein